MSAEIVLRTVDAVTLRPLPPQIVTVGVSGPQGPQGAMGPEGASAQRESRSDWVAPNSYIGIAAEGSLESASVWKITRVTVSGNIVTTAIATPVAWTDRLTAIYS